MKALDALNIVNDLSASQRGMFTSAQAQAAGADKMALSRLAKYGHIERVGHGVYRSCAAPWPLDAEVYAAWLALHPRIPAYERPKDETEFVVSLNTAAWLHGVGELNPEPITFSHPLRRQSRKDGLRFVKRTLDSNDIAVVAGVPTTTLERTVLDLIDYGEDLSLVANALADAVGKDEALSSEGFRQSVNARAKKRGFPAGFDLYEYLRS